jgi:hypothetical protein
MNEIRNKFTPEIKALLTKKDYYKIINDAIEKGRVDIFNYFLENYIRYEISLRPPGNTNFNIIANYNIDYTQMISNAIKYQMLNIIEFLLQSPIYSQYAVDHLFISSSTLRDMLYEIVQNDNVDMLKYFLEKSPEKIKEISKDFTEKLLKLATESGKFPILLYMENYIKTSLKDYYLMPYVKTILYVAAKYGQLNILKYFFEEYKVRFDDMLEVAAQANRLAVVKYLLEDVPEQFQINKKEALRKAILNTNNATNVRNYLLHDSPDRSIVKKYYDMYFRNG